MTDLATGCVFAGCRIDGIAGRGGMGVVYCATELSLGRPVALKVILADRATDPEFRERFQREQRVAAAIDHPHVVPVFGAGEEDGRLYLIMRLVGGTDLHALLRDHGPLGAERAAAMAAQVGGALDAAHAAGLVHRDVKPANVLLDGAHAYLADFGLMRSLAGDSSITHTGRWMGTVDYAAPEQLHAHRMDARSDVYALGCVLYAALTGGPPFPRETVPAAILAHLHEPPPRPSAAGAPAAFDRVIARALAKAPTDRYPSAGDLGRAALAAARDEPITEEERSVARGDAAPDAPTRVLAAPTERREAHRPAAVPVRRSRGRRRAVVATAAALSTVSVVAGFAITGALGTGRAGTPPTGPVSEDEARALLDRFASAYGDESAARLAATLARDVKRTDPQKQQRGRSAVRREYQRQFSGNDITAYELDELRVDGGDVARAQGRYVVRAGDAAAFQGRIVFSVVRERGKPRIALIAAVPSS